MTSSANKIDIAIVGGGILGLWSAYTILKKHPGLFVVVFEAESYLGEHTTGRNSEVLHSGLYYAINSLKHKNCLQGNVLWREYLAKKNIPFLDCGKIIVASEDQKQSLENLFKRAVENKVLGLRKLTLEEIHTFQDKLNFADGFFISSSGVLNVSECIASLRYDIEAMGGVIMTNNRVILKSFSPMSFTIEVNGDEIEARNLVNAAGLFAVDFRRNLGLVDYENYYVKGNYLKLKKKLDLGQLIYPIPPSDGLGLGVHLTMDTSGEQKFGPDTQEVLEINYSLSDNAIGKMTPSIQKIFKNVKESDLQLGYSGIRPKVRKNGHLITDFIFNTPKEHNIAGYFEFLGIESPGLTAAPSLAQNLCDALNL